MLPSRILEQERKRTKHESLNSVTDLGATKGEKQSDPQCVCGRGKAGFTEKVKDKKGSEELAKSVQ